MASQETRRRGPGRPPNTSEPATATRQRILEVATDLFAEKGFHATGVAEIGERAGVQRGALYYHIRSKDDLLWNVLREHIEVAADAAEAVQGSDLAPLVKVETLIREHVRTSLRFRNALRIYLRDSGALVGERATELQSLRNRVEAAWRRIFEEAERAGVVRDADGVMVSSILSMANMAAWWYNPDGPSSPGDVAERVAQIALNGICASAGWRPTGG